MFAAALVLMAILTHDRVFLAGNDASRFAQMEALVDYGHPYINESRYARTVDRVTIGGKDFSNKPPLLSLIGAGVYFLLEKAGGLSFAHDDAWVVYILTFLLVGVPGAWLVTLFHSSLRRHAAASPRAIWLATSALAAGTLLTSFSGTMNNHTVTAALLFAAFDAALGGMAVAAGLWSALAACIDIVPGVLFIPVFALMLQDGARRRFAIPIAAGAATFAACNLWIVGSPLPAKMVRGAVDHSSQFGASVAGVLLPDSWIYPLECLFGWHGFFTVSPVLAFGIAGLALAARAGRPLPRRECVALCLAMGAMAAGHVVFVGSYGGWSYGFRYLIPIIPLLLFFAPRAIERAPWLFTATLAISGLFAAIGAYNPWPPAYEQERNKDPVASLVTNPIGGNASAWMEEHFPGARLTEAMKARFIGGSPRERARYLALFYLDKGDRPMVDRMRETPRR